MRELRRFLALTLVIGLLLTVFAGATIKSKLPVLDADSFTQKQLDAAALLKPLGVLSGTEENMLGAGKVTRAQMVTFLYRLNMGGNKGVENYASRKALFKDVAPNEWYAPYINWAYSTGVVLGMGDGTFAPNDPVTGVQAAAMLVRMLGREASGADYAQKAQAHAIDLGLDKGIETKGLYENPLDRGDMFILLANTLMAKTEKGTIAENSFDLEIINGAILLEMDHIDKINQKNPYTVFTFRTWTGGNVQNFGTDILCIEGGEAEVAEDYGCKFTLLVSKKQIDEPTSNQGYRRLYAAYEEEQNDYYKIVTGTVDDGKLKFASLDQNVFYDDNCFFYVAGKRATKAEFEASIYDNGSPIANKAVYKLIDNDGDKRFEFAIVDRLSLEKIEPDTITAKVIAVSADGKLTLKTADGKTYENLRCGEYYDIDLETVLRPAASIRAALGVKQPDYRDFTAISAVYYDFGVKDGYVYSIAASKMTDFSGNYGIFVQWSDDETMYKNMPYGLFVDENSDYFWAYVETIDEAKAAGKADDTPENSLIYFTDADYTDDVVSFDTAGFWNSNYTYRKLLAPSVCTPDDASETLTVTFTNKTISVLHSKSFDYSLYANFGETYAVFDEDPGGLQYWNVSTQTFEDVSYGNYVDSSDNRLFYGHALEDYRDIEGRYLVRIDESYEFYGIAAMKECIGFVFYTDAQISVTLGRRAVAPTAAKEFQVYKRNGFWHLRYYFDLDDIDEDCVTVTWGDHLLEKDPNTGKWRIDLGDGTDPGTDTEYVPVKALLPGFNDTEFTNAFEDALDQFIAANQGRKNVRSDYTLLEPASGVIFAYAPVVNHANKEDWRWVAFTAEEFDADFGYGEPGNDAIDIGNKADELLFTVLNGKTYIKAVKISDRDAEHLPYGWLIPNGYELIVFGGLSDGANEDGWGVRLLFVEDLSIRSSTVFTKVNIFDEDGKLILKSGDVLLIKRDKNGAITEMLRVGNDYQDYLRYAIDMAKALEEED